MIAKAKPAHKAVKKTAPGKPIFQVTPPEKPMGKPELLRTVAELAGNSPAQAEKTIEAFMAVLAAHIISKGPGTFTYGGYFKVKVAKRAPTAAKTVMNHLTKKEITISAKPERRVIQLTPLTKMKEMV